MLSLIKFASVKMKLIIILLLNIIALVSANTNYIVESLLEKPYHFPRGCRKDQILLAIGNEILHRSYTIIIKNNSRCKFVLMAAVDYSGSWTNTSLKEIKEFISRPNVDQPNKKAYNPSKYLHPGHCETFAILSTDVFENAQGWVRYSCEEDNSAIHIHFNNPVAFRGFCTVKAVAYEVTVNQYRYSSFTNNHICDVRIDEMKKLSRYADDDLDYNCRCPAPPNFFYRDRHYAKSYNDSFVYTTASHYRIV